jgi:chemosensory pili system protein ChpA (sensor histidine kinase/response regulator)
MDSFSIADVGEHFRDDMHQVLESAAVRLAQLPAALVPDPDLGPGLAAIEDAGHTIAGSAALVGATGLAATGTALSRLVEEARAVLDEREAATRRLAALLRAAGIVLPDCSRLLALEVAGDRAAADALSAILCGRLVGTVELEPAATEEPQPDDEPGFDFGDEPVEAPPIVAEAAAGADFFVLETPPAEVAAGADFAGGLDPAIREAFGQEAGEILDALDQAALALERGDEIAPLVRDLFRGYHTFKGSANTVGLTALGAAVHRAEDVLEAWDPATLDRRAAATALLRVQRALRTALAPEGAIPDPEWVTGELQRAAAGERPAESGTGTHRREAAAASQVAAEDAVDGRRSMRIASDRLDHLMRQAGELVVTRSRLAARIAELGSTQRELVGSRDRLLATVEGFRLRNEFTGLDGRRGPGLWNRQDSSRPHPRPAKGRVEELFSELELDRYEDIHVLARSLSEITSDIGELQGQIQRALGSIGEDAEQLGRAVGGIQGEITRARMVPLEPLFARLHLAAQDAAERAHKAVKVTQTGAAVALDKSIVEGIQAPLLHLVRNAVAHGIEAPEVRTLDGKRPDGHVTITAVQEGGQIVVTVADDGSGLDLGKLHRRGLALGLIDVATPVDSEAVRNLVFVPGLSTTEQADAVSGRGFGCDVARREIQRLGGTLTVASQRGSGTTFTITLPLTLAITRALLVGAGGGRFAVPMNFVERILDLEQSRISLAGGQRRLAHGDEEVPLLDLATALGMRHDPRAERGAALLIRLGGRRWALHVDLLLRQEDVVVGSLGDLLSGHPLFAGVTFAGAAGLVPIIDLPGLLSAGQPGAPQLAAPVPSAPVESGPRRLRVLFADDSLSVRRVAERLLRSLGVEPVLAVDGEDALAKLRLEPVDLVFSDLEMPRMHGYDLLRELRFIPAHRALPVVIVTSRGGEKHRALAQQLGADGYLTKPFSADQLGAALARLVPGFQLPGAV